VSHSRPHVILLSVGPFQKHLYPNRQTSAGRHAIYARRSEVVHNRRSASTQGHRSNESAGFNKAVGQKALEDRPKPDNLPTHRCHRAHIRKTICRHRSATINAKVNVPDLRARPDPGVMRGSAIIDKVRASPSPPSRQEIHVLISCVKRLAGQMRLLPASRCIRTASTAAGFWANHDRRPPQGPNSRGARPLPDMGSIFNRHPQGADEEALVMLSDILRPGFRMRGSLMVRLAPRQHRGRSSGRAIGWRRF